jgi:hypothetical protein
MRLQCQLASNGIYVGGPDGYRHPRVGDLKAGAADWLLLWQIDTDEDAKWMWATSAPSTTGPAAGTSPRATSTGSG